MLAENNITDDDSFDIDEYTLSDFEEGSDSGDSNQQRERSKWKYDSRTGERLPENAEANEFTISGSERSNRQPINVLTGERVAWDTPLGGNINTYQNFLANSPCDKLTGKKLALGTELSEFVVTYSYIMHHWPYNAQTAERIPEFQTPYSEHVIPYFRLLDRWPYRKSTGEKLKWSQSGEVGVVPYSQIKRNWPYDSETGKKLEFGTPIRGKVLPYWKVKDSWPHSKSTGNKLPVGTKVDNVNIVPFWKLRKLWPYNSDTGEKMPYGTPYTDIIWKYEDVYKLYIREVAGTGEIIRGRLALEKAIAADKKLYIHPTQRSKLLFYKEETDEHRCGSPPKPFTDIFKRHELFCRSTLITKMKKEGKNWLVYASGPKKGRRAPVGAKLGDIVMTDGEKVAIVTAHEEYKTRIRENRYRHYWKTGDLSQVRSCEEGASTHSEGVVFTPAAQALLKEEKNESRKVSATERFVQADDAETLVKKVKNGIERR